MEVLPPNVPQCSVMFHVKVHEKFQLDQRVVWDSVGLFQCSTDYKRLPRSSLDSLFLFLFMYIYFFWRYIYFFIVKDTPVFYSN